MAEDVARCGLLRSLNVSPILDGNGKETGKLEIPADGRCNQALSLLMEQTRPAKALPIPCIISDIVAEDDTTPEQLTAFTVNQDHEFLIQVWDAVTNS